MQIETTVSRRWFFLLLLPFLLCAEGVPSLLSFGAGAFDFYRPKHRTFEFEIEYKFHFDCIKPPIPQLQFRPLIGAMATAKGSFYGYLGINFDLLFFKHLLFAPGFAAGYFAPGGGKNLGYPIEFRSGAEIGWQFSDWHRFGLHFYHLSNASIGRRNPGEESLIFFYDIPITKGFPFVRDN